MGKLERRHVSFSRAAKQVGSRASTVSAATRAGREPLAAGYNHDPRHLPEDRALTAVTHQWEAKIDGRWQPLEARRLPAPLRSNKPVRFACRGVVITARDDAGGERENRLGRPAGEATR